MKLKMIKLSNTKLYFKNKNEAIKFYNIDIPQYCINIIIYIIHYIILIFIFLINNFNIYKY